MPNRALWWLVGAASVALAAAIYLPPLQAIFRFEALSAGDIGLALFAACAGVIWSEAIKAIRRARLESIRI